MRKFLVKEKMENVILLCNNKGYFWGNDPWTESTTMLKNALIDVKNRHGY